MIRESGEIDLRREARALFDVALRSVDAGDAVRNAVRLDGPRLTIQNTTIDLEQTSRRVYVLAMGKAAFPMAVALDDVLKDRITEGLAIGQAQNSGKPLLTLKQLVPRWRLLEGDHPLPSESSLTAAQSAFELLRRANHDGALVIFLISGGGSSMIEWPRNEQITLADLRAANRALVSCGASIAEINSVRRAFSAVKGGRLAMHAPLADQVTLVVSDTAQGQESIVASGPTLDPPTQAPDPVDVIMRHQLAEQLPASILHAVQLPMETQDRKGHNSLRQTYVLLDNETAIMAATDEARRRGFAAEFATDISEQPIAEGCRIMLKRVTELLSRDANAERIVCLVSGGEFSCPVRGDGIGGRNSETALRCAVQLARIGRRGATNIRMNLVAVLSAGTDGVDGISPAAGAIADETTCDRAAKLGLEPDDYLERSDAYSFFDVLGDTIETGPTGTNVRDVRLVLATEF